ncbi:MAG TPA: hypothetical protein VFJ71_09600 [Candidatus Limnocylindrales bacterium]|nr:hypothetical protein [Candidatus Limnocylindrales bacterium]
MSDSVDVHLEDGGNVVVTFEDADVVDHVGDAVIDVLVHTSGGERDLERAVTATVEGLGLQVRPHSSRRPTILDIERG